MDLKPFLRQARYAASQARPKWRLGEAGLLGNSLYCELASSGSVKKLTKRVSLK